MTKDNPNDLLTLKEAAQVLRVSDRTVIRRRDDGELPCVKHGRRVLFRRSDINDYLERCWRRG